MQSLRHLRIQPVSVLRRTLSSTSPPANVPNYDKAKSHLGVGISRLSNMTMQSAQGCTVTSTDGRQFLDFTSGIAVTSTGHCHPKVTAAVVKQVGTLVHGQIGIGYHEPMLKLVDKLVPLLPTGPQSSLFFTNSGSEAVEAAIKVARAATGKNNVIVFQGSFHGRTYGLIPHVPSLFLFTVA